MATKTPSTPPTSTASTATPNGNGYAPSVPISVYRQLATELDSTKAQLQSTTQQNHYLVRQNQQLQQEVERLVQSALAVQQLVSGHSTATQSPAASPSAQPTPQPQSPPPSAPPPSEQSSAAEPMPIPPKLPNFDEFFTEQPSDPSFSKKDKPSRDMGGFWLALVIIVVMLTAFGAGFFVVRPMLQQNSDR